MNGTIHFDADAYYRSGKCPWTFFAYPRVLTGANGLPPDNDAKRLIAALQDRGIPVSVWLNSPVEDSAFFACPNEVKEQLVNAISSLEESGEFEKDFCSKRTEYLFSLVYTTIQSSSAPNQPGT